MKKMLAFSLLVLLCSACATVIDGKKQQISFESNEKDVEIYINNGFACRTPCLTEANRGNEKLMIVAKKEGFEERTLFLDKNINMSTFFNVLSLGFSSFGVSTDLSTGDMWEYRPNSVYVVMTKTPKSAADRQKLKKQNEVRDFVLKNYDALQEDAYREQGTGEYIKTLSGISNIPANKIIEVLKNTYIETDSAERIVGLMLSK